VVVAPLAQLETLVVTVTMVPKETMAPLETMVHPLSQNVLPRPRPPSVVATLVQLAIVVQLVQKAPLEAQDRKVPQEMTVNLVSVQLGTWVHLAVQVKLDQKDHQGMTVAQFPVDKLDQLDHPVHQDRTVLLVMLVLLARPVNQETMECQGAQETKVPTVTLATEVTTATLDLEVPLDHLALVTNARPLD